MAQLPPEIEKIFKPMLVRRKDDKTRWLREERSRIAERMSFEGTSMSGAFVTTVAKAHGLAFSECAKGAMDDGLKLLRQALGDISSEHADALKERLEAYFDQLARSFQAGEAEPGSFKGEIADTIRRVIERSLSDAKRDLRIELDLATLKTPRVATIVDDALMDPLVPLQNRRGFEAAFPKFTKDRSERFCLVLFDIDHFKDVNDKNGGHAIGDEALKSVADVARKCVKGKGEVFRWGGDEFVMLLPNHTMEEALSVAERFRREVQSSPHTSRNLPLSVSVGVAEWPSNASDLETLHKAADLALYDAKNRGRNIVRYYGEPEPQTDNTAREPSRRQPDPQGLTRDQADAIRADYFRSRVARCPHDEALLDVENITGLGQTRDSIYISCPMCGLSAELD